MPSCSLVDPDVLALRVAEARAGLRSCKFCELRCGADRIAGDPAPCRLGADTHVFKRYISLTDEREVVPTLRVYLGGCNFRCRFCNTAPNCFEPAFGERVDPARLAGELADEAGPSVRTISFLGGEPSLHVHTLLEIVAASDSLPPLVLNTNMYMTPQVLEWLEGVVSCFSADFKFGNDRCALSLAGMPRYTEVVTRNLRAAADRGAGLIVRHLLMPGHGNCCFRPVADWVSHHLPGTRFQLSTAYVPSWKAATDPRLGRLNYPEEVKSANEYLAGLGLRTSAPEGDSGCDPIKLPEGDGPIVTITLGVDGRVYWHDLTPTLCPVAVALCPEDAELRLRAPRETEPGTGSSGDQVR